jgi:hypothetical protein
MGVEDGIQIDRAEKIDYWLAEHGQAEREL